MPEVDSFHDAVKRGDLSAVQAALHATPELLNATNASGQTAFVLANYYNQPGVASFLLTLQPQLDVFSASIAGLEDRVLAMIEGDPSLIGGHNSDGWTPLHLASFFGKANLAAALIERGADVNARSTNQMQNAPLHAAVAGRKTQIVKLLLAQGADANRAQRGGWTPLHGAAQNGDVEIVEALIASGAHVHARADNNQLPIDLAMTRGHSDVVALLQLQGEEAAAQ